jgi:hypothetical protein
VTTLEAALDFARLGLQTLPVHFIMTGSEVVCSCGARDCDSVGKHPIAELVPHGFENASSNPRVIAHWFKRHPHANVGMVVGLVCVIDVDPRHRGDETLRRLERAHGHLPTTWRATTGGGGEHVFFAAPEGGIASGRLGQGIDFKGRLGYVVVAPSSHVSGRRYAWQRDPHTTPLAPLPAWVIRTLQRKQHRSHIDRTINLDAVPTKLGGIIRAIADAPEGERNRLLYWGACRLRELADQQAIPRDDAIEIAVEAARRSGLPRSEALRTARSALGGQ